MQLIPLYRPSDLKVNLTEGNSVANWATTPLDVSNRNNIHIRVYQYGNGVAGSEMYLQSSSQNRIDSDPDDFNYVTYRDASGNVKKLVLKQVHLTGQFTNIHMTYDTQALSLIRFTAKKTAGTSPDMQIYLID